VRRAWLVVSSPVLRVCLQIVRPMRISGVFLVLPLGVASSVFSSDRPEENRTAIQLRDRMSPVREGRVSRPPTRQDVACQKAGCRKLAKAGCCTKSRQGVAVHVFAHKNTVSLLAISPPGCRQAACDRLAQRRSIPWSGRRGSNPRQPAWKAVCHKFAVWLLLIGSTSASSTHIFIPRTSDIVCCVNI
jgi:hypothetical protein